MRSFAAAVTSNNKTPTSASLQLNSRTTTPASTGTSNLSASSLSKSADTYAPSRRNAIIIENTHEIPQDRVLRAVADIIGGRNIHYCTRLSGGRICLYLTSEEWVNKAVNEGGIIVNSIYLPVRRYVTEATKVVVSNCPPELDDNKLKELLEPYGKVVSSPSRLKVSTTYADLKHIKTWRRVVYIMPSLNSEEMPKRLNIISPENIKYTLYLDKDEVTCDYCKAPGHQISKCKKKISDEQNIHLNNETNTSSSSRETPSSPQDNHDQEQRPAFIHSTPKEVQAVIQPTQDAITKRFSKTSTEDQMMKNSYEETSIQSTSTNLEKVDHPSRTSQDVNSGLSNLFLPHFNTFEQSIHTAESANLLSSEGDSINLNTTPTDLQQIPMDPASVCLPIYSMDQDSEIISLTSVKPTNNSKKRPLSSSPSQDDSEDSCTSAASSQSNKSQKKPNKKQKQKKEKEDQQINILLNQMKQKSSYIPQETFKEFLTTARGSQNSKAVAGRLGVTDISALIVQLNDAATLCQDFNLQRRLKRASDALITQNEA